MLAKEPHDGIVIQKHEIASPLEISGEARGFCFFCAVF